MSNKRLYPNRRMYPTEDDPKYGKPFYVTGVQLIDIDGNYTSLIKLRLNKEGDKLNRVFKLKDWGEYRTFKRKISDEIVNIFKTCEIAYKDVVAIEIKYFSFDENFII